LEEAPLLFQRVGIEKVEGDYTYRNIHGASNVMARLLAADNGKTIAAVDWLAQRRLKGDFCVYPALDAHYGVHLSDVFADTRSCPASSRATGWASHRVVGQTPLLKELLLPT
jgi:hypothetical protein